MENYCSLSYLQFIDPKLVCSCDIEDMLFNFNVHCKLFCQVMKLIMSSGCYCSNYNL